MMNKRPCTDPGAARRDSLQFLEFINMPQKDKDIMMEALLQDTETHRPDLSGPEETSTLYKKVKYYVLRLKYPDFRKKGSEDEINQAKFYDYALISASTWNKIAGGKNNTENKEKNVERISEKTMLRLVIALRLDRKEADNFLGILGYKLKLKKAEYSHKDFKNKEYKYIMDLIDMGYTLGDGRIIRPFDFKMILYEFFKGTDYVHSSIYGDLEDCGNLGI